MNTKNRLSVCIAALFFVVPALSQEASSQSETPDLAGSLVLVAGKIGQLRLQDRDLKNLMKSRDVPSVIALQSRRMLEKKGKI